MTTSCLSSLSAGVDHTTSNYVPNSFSVSCLDCSGCPFGEKLVREEFDQVGECKPCPAGSYSEEGSEECHLCPPGTISSTGQGACQECGPGKYASSPSKCEKCQIGTSNSHGSATICRPCGPGTMTNSSGASYCTPCLPGFFASDSSTCRVCPAGTFSSGRSCSKCPAGTFSSRGSNECTGERSLRIFFHFFF